jgi:hypothetical protein
MKKEARDEAGKHIYIFTNTQEDTTHTASAFPAALKEST